jgi:hypothetical protein
LADYRRDDAEVEEALAHMRPQLEEEHARRLEEFKRRRSLAHERGAEHRERVREEELADLKARVRERFYGEKDYRRYTDSRGQETWLPREEYEWRMKVRRSRARRHREYRSSVFLTGRTRTVVLYGIVVVVAVVVGLLVALRG